MPSEVAILWSRWATDFHTCAPAEYSAAAFRRATRLSVPSYGWVVPPSRLNRTQLLVVAFIVCAWLTLVVLYVGAPGVFRQAMRLDPESQEVGGAALAAISVLVAVVTTGVMRRWRWLFWLLVVALLAGIARPVVFALEITGVVTPSIRSGMRRFRRLLASSRS